MIIMDKLSQKGLSIVFWNVRSLVNKVDSVRESIHAAKPDLVSLKPGFMLTLLIVYLVYLNTASIEPTG